MILNRSLFWIGLKSVILSLLLSTSAMADEYWSKDITNDLVQFMSTQFVGKKGYASRSWDDTTAGVGKKTFGEASATVSDFVSYSSRASNVTGLAAYDLRHTFGSLLASYIAGVIGSEVIVEVN